jgi:hypothetical protein
LPYLQFSEREHECDNDRRDQVQRLLALDAVDICVNIHVWHLTDNPIDYQRKGSEFVQDGCLVQRLW